MGSVDVVSFVTTLAAWLLGLLGREPKTGDSTASSRDGVGLTTESSYLSDPETPKKTLWFGMLANWRVDALGGGGERRYGDGGWPGDRRWS